LGVRNLKEKLNESLYAVILLVQSNLDTSKIKGNGFFLAIARSRYSEGSLYRDKKIVISWFLKQKNNIKKKYPVKNFYSPYAFKLNVLIFWKKICNFGLFEALMA